MPCAACFAGRRCVGTEFTVTPNPADFQARLGFAHSDLGIGNRLSLLDEEVHENLKSIQLRNGLQPF